MSDLVFGSDLTEFGASGGLNSTKHLDFAALPFPERAVYLGGQWTCSILTNQGCSSILRSLVRITLL
jgi:hypothetical protein